jgi:hypothetical protein
MKSKRTGSAMLAGLAVTVLFCVQAVPAVASAEGSFTRTLPVTGPVNLDLTTGSGSVNVRTGRSSQVLVTGHIKVTNWFRGNS